MALLTEPLELAGPYQSCRLYNSHLVIFAQPFKKVKFAICREELGRAPACRIMAFLHLALIMLHCAAVTFAALDEEASPAGFAARRFFSPGWRSRRIFGILEAWAHFRKSAPVHPICAVICD